MQTYNPKKWSAILFRFGKSDTLRKLSNPILLIAGYSAVIAILELNVFNIRDSVYVKNLHQMHSLLGFALSLLLVFRTNTAYDRWWEGRKLWGLLVNNSRNLAIKLRGILDVANDTDRDFFKRLIPLYAFTLKDHLQSEYTRYALDAREHPELEHLDMDKHAPNQIMAMISDRVMELHKQGKISAEQMLYINPEMTSFTDICGACERIKNTPIPISYSSFLKKFLFIYIVTLPIGYVFTLGYLIIPVVASVFYVLASLEIIAEEIEDPFGKDDNDLPMEKISQNIQKHIAEIL